MFQVTLAHFKSIPTQMSDKERSAFEYGACRLPFPDAGILAVTSLNDAVEALLHIGEDVHIKLNGTCNDSVVMQFSTLDAALEWLNTQGVSWAEKELKCFQQSQLDITFSSIE